MSSDRSSRPSPSVSATGYPEGYQMEGNDGNWWEISVDSRGVHRWVRMKNQPANQGKKPVAGTSSKFKLDDAVMITDAKAFNVLKSDTGDVNRFYINNIQQYPDGDYLYKLIREEDGHVLISEWHENQLQLLPDATTANKNFSKFKVGDLVKIEQDYFDGIKDNITGWENKFIVSNVDRDSDGNIYLLKRADNGQVLTSYFDDARLEFLPAATKSSAKENSPLGEFKIGDKVVFTSGAKKLIPTSADNNEHEVEKIDQELIIVSGIKASLHYTWFKIVKPAAVRYPEFNVGDRIKIKDDYYKKIVKGNADINEINEFTINYKSSDPKPEDIIYYINRDGGKVKHWGGDWSGENFELLKTPEQKAKTEKQKEEVVTTSGALPMGNIKVFDKQIDELKQQVNDLVFLRSMTSPIKFEERLEINQAIAEKQKEIDKLNFQITDQMIGSAKIFDDLFEQSFVPLKNSYEGVDNTEDNESDFFTPTGKPSKLSEKLNEQVRLPQFKEWFGDPQLAYFYKDSGSPDMDCSKVMTRDYEPQIVWHVTGAEFSYFKFDNFPAAYFAVNKAYSQFFADIHGGDGEGKVIPFFLNIRNPLDFTPFKVDLVKPKDFFDYMYVMTGLDVSQLEVNPMFLQDSTPAMEIWIYLRNNPKMLKKIANLHIYDGIHFYETNPSVPVGEAHQTEAWIAFSPEQIKIADPDRGLLLLASLKSFLLKSGGQI